MGRRDGTIYRKKGIYLDSFIIIHNPPFIIMTIGEAMIMLPIVANLKVTENMSEIKKKKKEYPINKVLPTNLKSYIKIHAKMRKPP